MPIQLPQASTTAAATVRGALTCCMTNDVVLYEYTVVVVVVLY